LVQDDELYLVELEAAALEMIDQASGGADYDLRSALEAVQLAIIGLAAVNGQGPQVLAVLAEFAHLLGDLYAQFPGGGQDQYLGRLDGRIHLLHGRHGEGDGLARACAGLADDVPPFQDMRYRLALDGGR